MGPCGSGGRRRQICVEEKSNRDASSPGAALNNAFIGNSISKSVDGERRWRRRLAAELRILLGQQSPTRARHRERERERERGMDGSGLGRGKWNENAKRTTAERVINGDFQNGKQSLLFVHCAIGIRKCRHKKR